MKFYNGNKQLGSIGNFEYCLRSYSWNKTFLLGNKLEKKYFNNWES